MLKIRTVLCEGNDNKHVLIGVMRGGGCWAQYRSIELSTKTIKARGSIWGSIGSSLWSQHFKLKIKDIGQLSVAYPCSPINNDKREP